jgi:excinuclease ABC subunit A
MTVDEAYDFFQDDAGLRRSLIREIGLGYIRLGQAATELSDDEAQRIKLATELQRAQRGGTLYILDDPLLERGSQLSDLPVGEAAGCKLR